MNIDLSHIVQNRNRSRSRSKIKKIDRQNQFLDNIQKDIPIYLEDSSQVKTYYERSWDRKKGVRHWGQRKLFITELYFLLNYQELSKTVIYAGAAPGNHIPYLSQLFPQHQFILVDPNEFQIKESKQIKIINEYFTDKMCEEFQKKYSDCLFISDIRTADYKIMKSDEHEQTIQKDNLLQANWVQCLKPCKAMLKFRCPYSGKLNISQIQMLDGIIYLQPWAPHSSTETRLICDLNSKWKEYDIKKYEDQLFYHNDVTRIEKRYKHGIQGEGITEDYDSTADLIQLYAYLKQNDQFQEYDMKKRLKYFSQEITQKLNCNRTLGTMNKPKENRRKFEEKDHRIFYQKINKIN